MHYECFPERCGDGFQPSYDPVPESIGVTELRFQVDVDIECNR